MAITIKTFTAKDTGFALVFTSDNPMTVANIILQDGNPLDILLYIAPTGNPGEYSADVPGDYQDGIFNLSLENSVESLGVAIGNTLIGNQCLLDRTLKDIFDCVLVQQLEATSQLILANQGDNARGIYADVLNTCSFCKEAELFTFVIAGTSIWIENSVYTIH